MTRAAVVLAILLALAGIVPGAGVQPGTADRERAYRANNLGVARLEQFDYDGAAQSFREALQLDPALHVGRVNLALALFYANNADAALQEARVAVGRVPDTTHLHYLLGHLARSLDRPDEAIASWRRVLQLDPTDVATKVYLGQLYLQQRNFGDALTLFRDALAAEPYNVTAAYNLATALIRSGAAGEGRQAMDRFQSLRDGTYGKTYSQTYLEQGKYGEAIASTGAEPELVDARTPAVTFADATTAVLPRRGVDRVGPTSRSGDLVGADGGGTLFRSGVTLADTDADGDLDLIDTGSHGVRLHRNDAGVFSDVSERAGLTSAASWASIGAVAADYDNDGRTDLFVLRLGGTALLRQTAEGRFEDVTASSRLPAHPHPARAAAFADVDHDGDLDIIVAGFAALNQLLRNNGNGSFTDITAAAGIGGGGSAVAVVPTDFDGRRDIDLLVVKGDGAPVLFQNLRDGTFRDAARDAGLPSSGRYTSVAAGDLNKDGAPDFFFGAPDAPGTFAMSDGSGRFAVRAGPDFTRGAVASQFIDYDNDGLLDLFVLTERRGHLFRNLGTSWTDVSDAAAFPALTARGAFEAMALGDVDGDGDTDAFVRDAEGGLSYWRNQGGNRHQSLRVRLAGRVSNRSGVGSKIDLRAGSLRQRLESSAATPAAAPADLLFGLGARPAGDVVRVLWPSGTLQAETDFGPAREGARVVTVNELDRKPSSCPYLYTWNGSRFEFVTDFMGGGEIGYWTGPGTWNQPDPDEYVRITGEQLKPRDGRYELRVTNELEEALFIDRLRLIAIDHPVGAEAYPNEGLGAPASGVAVTTTHGAHAVAGATDEHGHDVSGALARIDRRYVDDFSLRPIRGYADPHTLTLDLGDAADRAVLLMTGWTDYAFSGDNVAAHQSGQALSPPALQVKDPSGKWRTVIGNIGIPVGRPQTVVVDLRKKVPASTREVRIVTNMRIYWDQVLIDVSGGGAPAVMTPVDPAVASLRWRGFSAVSSPDGREPHGYDYDRVSQVSPWKVMTGRYTREGNVRPLVIGADDMFVVSRPGDEIALSFNESVLPALQPGTTRTFLLYAIGYSKEMDINSASPHTVEPMPFHSMSGYPYRPGEHYPRTDQHRRYLNEYNTRVVSRPIPAIEGGR